MSTKLSDATMNFLRIVQVEIKDEQYAYHYFASAVHQLCVAIREAELEGTKPETIRELLAPARDVHATSPFWHRLQTWPRGYAGDFETIEYLCDSTTQAAPGTIGYYIEHQALRNIAAQQHRNKVAWQAKQILQAVSSWNSARILTIGCGGSRDLRSIEPFLIEHDVRIYLNDFDPDAIKHSVSELPMLARKLTVIPGDVFTAVRRFRSSGPFDLILAGGLFDYLSDRQLIWLLPKLVACLSPQGRLCFTNIACGNPYRVWIENLADWEIIERSEADFERLMLESGLAKFADLKLTRESTGLTHLAILNRKNPEYSIPASESSN